MKDYKATIEYLKKNEVNDKEAVDTLKRALEINPTNVRSLWKISRFEMYIWQRMEEYDRDLLGKKIESCRRVVVSKNYMNEYKEHHPGIMGLKKTDAAYEAFKLNKLVTDPRQYPFFKSKYLRMPSPKLKKLNVMIPQEIIDKVR
tara:strand:+ start:1449 stop:1883 length:435 start_codon:yes stop_codon:yes gene_type:complete